MNITLPREKAIKAIARDYRDTFKTSLSVRVSELVNEYGADSRVVWEIERYESGLTLQDLAKHYNLS